MADLQFHVLGPVEVVRDGNPVKLGVSMVTLLTALLTSPNRVVPIGSLIDWTWGSQLPDHPRAALHNAVSRLRRLIGGEFIETSAWGYRLRADRERLDLLRFEHLRGTADFAIAHGLTTDAVAALDEAIALWHEPLLGNVESPTLRTEVVSELTERYLDVLEDRACLYVRLGRPGAVIGGLSKAARAHRYRERITCVLMIALARSGRQAEALAAYQALRVALQEDLGIDPSPEAQALFIKILRGDPHLPLPPGTAPRSARD